MGNPDFATEQEAFWAGDFGDAYIARNESPALYAANLALFSKILARMQLPVRSAIELGANIGLNLRALRALLPSVELTAVEINANAVEQLHRIPETRVYHQSILDFEPEATAELAFSKTVLIHIQPEMLARVYDRLYRSSSRYICIMEYYNPSPVEVVYRGHTGKLFKRDFAGEMLDLYTDLRLVDYGFVYGRDPTFPQDDISWFLLEKRGQGG